MLKHRNQLIRVASFVPIVLIYSISNGQTAQNLEAEQMKSNVEWRIPTTAPLLTKWARDVSPENAHREYPRPQMVRDEWMNLNGLWEFAESKSGDDPPAGKGLLGRILVPFPIESALSGVMKNTERIWYRRTFTLPKAWDKRRVILHFGAVDWEATVYLNGKRIGEHRGGYDAFYFDVTDALKENGPQELVVGVYDPSDGGEQPRGKQVRKPEGIWYTPSSGIWQTVWLEPVPADHIVGMVISSDVDKKCLRLTVNVSGDSANEEIKAIAMDGGRDVGAAGGRAGAEMQIPLSVLKLWSPSDPFLYDLKIQLVRNGETIDEVKSYFGMRKIQIGKDERGVNRILLNGKFAMLVGPLDQGFWPDGLYTAPCDEALRFDIEMTKRLGFNMTRKHVKIEPERWYYWADKLGLLVWQDMPSGNNRTPESKKQFEIELAQMVQTHRNHPSIIMWVIFNEGWGQYDTERLSAWVKQIDPTRLVNNASGWTDKNVGHVKDIHSYPAPKAPPGESDRAIVLGEFGGLGLAVDGHTWKKEHWGYQGMVNADQLTSRYEKFMKTVYQLKDSPGLCAAVYTQITDVEVECNGLVTYDRAVVKPDIERIAAVNQGDFSKIPPSPVLRMIVPTSEQQGQAWQYTFQRPEESWFRPEFDASHWKAGLGGFGTEGTPGAIVRTEWKTPDIWLRRDVTLPDEKFISLQFRLHHDEDVEIYINGVLAGTFTGYSTEYEEYPITPEGRSALKPGKNTIAVHCRQTGGGQYVDGGIVDVILVKTAR